MIDIISLFHINSHHFFSPVSAMFYPRRIRTSLSAALAGTGVELFSSNGAVRLQRGHDTADQLHILQCDVRTEKSERMMTFLLILAAFHD